MTRNAGFDVIVVGGGVAGSATALALGRLGRSVLIIERTHYESWRVGEFLWPSVRVLLAELGVWDRFLADGHKPAQGVYSAWGGADLLATDFIFDPYGRGWRLDRARFDAMLARAAEEAGAIVLRGAMVASVVRGTDRWQVVVEQNGTTRKEEAPFLVDATGRVGRLARSQGGRWLCYDREIAMVGILRQQPFAKDASSILLLEASQDGWWYSLRLPDGSLLVAYMTDGSYLSSSSLNPTAFWTRELSRTGPTAGRVEGHELQGAARVRSAATGRLDRAAGPGWIAVGDAASTFDPLTGSGIPKAMHDASRAAKMLAERSAHPRAVLDDYADGVVDRFADYQEQRTSYYQMEQRWPDSPFWRRRHAGVQHQPALQSS